MAGPSRPLGIAVAGTSGRMGRMLVDAVAAAADCRLTGALDIAGSPALGQDAGSPSGLALGVAITDDLPRGLAGADVLIDFTRPAGTMRHLQACQAARQLPIVLAPNMSVGVNVMLRLLEQAAGSLAEGYDVEVIEAHHRHKVDAPSGTALAMGEVLARALGRRLDDCAVFAREGVTGERPASAIGFSTIRGGDIVGDHTVLFAGTGERIEITHRSNSRANYAAGALRAARYLVGRAPGLYGMNDVLGLA